MIKFIFLFFSFFMFFVMYSRQSAMAEEILSPETKLIPREILFGNPEKASPKISPDGHCIAYLAPVNKILNIRVKTIGTEDDRVVTDDKKRSILSYFWAFDSRHILYIQDTAGNENYNLYSVDLKTGEIKNLTPFEDVQVRILAVDKHFPDEILITMNKENKELHDVYRLTLSTGKLDMVVKNPGHVTRWVEDADFKVRVAEQNNDDGSADILLRKDENSSWEKIFSWNAEDNSMSGVKGFSKDGEYLYLTDSRDYNAARLVKLNIKTGKTEVMAEDPEYDVNRLLIDQDTYEIQALSFYKAREEWVVLDEKIKSDFEAIKKLHAGDFTIGSRDRNDRIWIVSFVSDIEPVSYYIYDRITKKGTFLFDTQPALKSYTLAPLEPVSFMSRDGLTIHGYITFPPGKERKNLPLVLSVHGGPRHRDKWGYIPEAQWFANRGYACLKINFRGSTGYGKDFLHKGDRQWGNNMHNDLVDGVNWAIKEGIASPEKIAIYGGSYGGYAALAGATFTPELFCCAVDMFGPSNLITLAKSMPPYWKPARAQMVQMMGDVDKEEDFLKSRSPLFSVENIKIPMLIAQGANDPRVKQAESEQIVEAMKKRGIYYEYVLFPDEGHGFLKEENRLKFYEIAEKFLSRYLGGTCE
ncbi:MAG: S9 family peptidase [Candidatus Eremiobacterota bacterium]